MTNESPAELGIHRFRLWLFWLLQGQRDGGADQLEGVALVGGRFGEDGHVNRTVSAVRELADQCGIDVEIGLTTGAWIVPDLQSRIDMISDWEDVDYATANLSDQVMEAMRSSGIGIDVSLWDLSEIERFARLRIRPSRAACQDRAGPR